MEDDEKEDIIKITERNYQKLAKSLQKEGFREGRSSADEKFFQKSFDNGYEDGFRIGFLLGKSKKEKAKYGNCEICKNSQLLKGKTENEMREIVREIYENELKCPR
ncbi:hypothetical protein PVAND_001602 [Polypedilum vanderplanki]|uniref:Essential protein Yae1 N-terminal domain-containing protein n=1 Tax=Polypedilum vanderplanki TaxID=319348 RepID=A0A9J6BNG0_POLVA|nr:hypothetical protein PVAND_001602 [Polypedilum vanderplanki]